METPPTPRAGRAFSGSPGGSAPPLPSSPLPRAGPGRTEKAQEPGPCHKPHIPVAGSFGQRGHSFQCPTAREKAVLWRTDSARLACSLWGDCWCLHAHEPQQLLSCLGRGSRGGKAHVLESSSGLESAARVVHRSVSVTPLARMVSHVAGVLSTPRMS